MRRVPQKPKWPIEPKKILKILERMALQKRIADKAAKEHGRVS